ncbi:MAG: hypothetical protein F4Z21_14980, partial [Acidobacteria bacterium]|nr:hypothetical protein [Acidobacteriota bacterium]
MERNCRLTAIGIWISLVLPLVAGEAAAQIRISKSSLTIDEGGEGFYRVHLDAQPSAETTLEITTTNSDVRVKPTSLTFTPDDWGEARKITVEAIEDADAEDDRATVGHSVRATSDKRGGTANPSAVTATTTSSLKVTVRDRSVPSHEVNISPSSGLSVRKGGSGTYSVSLTEQPTASVSISASSNQSDVKVSPSSLTFYAGTWSSAQSFTVSVDAGATSSSATISHSATSEDFNYQGLSIESLPVTVLQPPAGITHPPSKITCGADGTNIQLGNSSTLSWDSTNASSVTIDQGIGTVSLDSPAQGKSVTPPQPGAAETSKATTYRFTASGAGKSGRCSVTITVWRPPNVDRFSAAPSTLRKQQATKLTWATSHASDTSINQGIGTVPADGPGGGRSVDPRQPSTAESSRSTSYTLTASNPGYSGSDAASATVRVTVWNRPSVNSFTASPSTIEKGEDSSLKWTTTHATGVAIDQGVGSVSVDDETGTTKVSPDQTTTYTLTASNPGYTGAHAATGTVRVT